MAASPQNAHPVHPAVVRFGEFEVDLQSGVLSSKGTKTLLQGQSLQLLQLLLEHMGQVVTREQIQQRLWPDGTVVEFEHSVNAAVKRLRETLGDDADEPVYIETIPRRGYRLIAPLGPPKQPALRPGPWIRVMEASRWWPAVPILMISAAALVLGYSWVRRQVAGPSPAASTPVVLQRLTDSLGVEDVPAVSPDGKSVAFSAGAGTPQIWVRLLAGGRPLRITHDHVPHLYPRWSPDSASIIYFSPAEEPDVEGAIYEIPALGGGPRRLVSSFTGGDISHDGTRLAYFRRNVIKLELVVADRSGSNLRVLASLPQDYDYGLPRWSPDDRLIAYRSGRVFNYNIFAVPFPDGGPRRITRKLKVLAGYSWIPDGSGIVCSSSRNSTSLYLPNLDLFVASLDGRSLRQLTFGDTSFLDPDVDSKGRVFVTEQRRDFNVWSFPIDGSPADNVRRALASDESDGARADAVAQSGRSRNGLPVGVRRPHQLVGDGAGWLRRRSPNHLRN